MVAEACTGLCKLTLFCSYLGRRSHQPLFVCLLVFSCYVDAGNTGEDSKELEETERRCKDSGGEWGQVLTVTQGDTSKCRARSREDNG